MTAKRGSKLTRRALLGATAAGAATLVVSGGATIARSIAAPTVVSKGQTLKIAFTGTQVSPTDKSVADNFAKKFPGVKIDFIPIQGTDWNQYFSKVLTMIAAGTLPDLMYVATEGTQLFAGQGLSTPLDDYVKRDKAELQEYFADVHPSLVEAMMYEGNLYELPAEFNAANMFLNTKLMQDNDLDYPAPDWDKDTFYKYAQAMSKKGGGPPFGYDWVNRLWGGWMPWIFVNGSNLLTESRAPGGQWLWETFYPNDPSVKERGGGWRWQAPQANAAANIDALEFVVQLAKEHLTPSISVGGGDLLQGFFTGNKLGMTPAGGFWAGGLDNAGMKPDAFDVQLFPKWKSQRHQFGTGGYIILDKAKNKDLAWEYIKHYMSKSTLEDVLKGNSSTPARRSMITAERYASTGPKHWQVFYDTLDKHPDTAPIPAPPQANPMTTIFMKYTGLAATGSQSPKDALDNMQKDLAKLFKSKS